jgi:hypothetical protein
MEKGPSFLEKLSDRLLKKFLNLFSKDDDWLEIDENFIEKCDTIVKMTGFSKIASSSDISFLSELLKLNQEISPEIPLIRPKFSLFEFDWISYETRWVRNIYRNASGSYSPNGDDISEMVYQFRYLGEFYPEEGDFIDEDTRDSEITDEEMGDIRKIK